MPRRSMAGVTRLFRLGGAHAVAALAFGTRMVPKVDKIVGPGIGTSPPRRPPSRDVMRDRF